MAVRFDDFDPSAAFLLPAATDNQKQQQLNSCFPKQSEQLYPKPQISTELKSEWFQHIVNILTLFSIIVLLSQHL